MKIVSSSLLEGIFERHDATSIVKIRGALTSPLIGDLPCISFFTCHKQWYEVCILLGCLVSLAALANMIESIALVHILLGMQLSTVRALGFGSLFVMVTLQSLTKAI